MVIKSGSTSSEQHVCLRYPRWTLFLLQAVNFLQVADWCGTCEIVVRTVRAAKRICTLAGRLFSELFVAGGTRSDIIAVLVSQQQ